MAVSVLSSVLPVSFCLSLGTAPETDQSLTLIHSEWSRRRDRELCDYWTLTLYQFQSFYSTRLSHTRCITHSVWSPTIQSYGCYWSWGIFLHFLMRENTFCGPKVPPAEIHWLPWKIGVGEVSGPSFATTAKTIFFCLPIVRWQDKHHSHVCLLNIRLYLTAGCLSLAQRLQTDETTSLAVMCDPY